MATVLIENGREIGGSAESKTIDYSFEEHIIGTWVDGSTLYEKTVNIGALPNNNTINVPHGITNLAFVVSISGSSKQGAYDIYIPLPYHAPDGTECRITVVNDDIRVYTPQDMSVFTTSYITIRYTKTN